MYIEIYLQLGYLWGYRDGRMGVFVADSKRLRKDTVKRVREEGRQAALAGKHIQTNPYKYMNAHQWASGYQWGLDERLAAGWPHISTEDTEVANAL